MRGLLQLGTVARTPIRVHWATWLLPLGMLVYAWYIGAPLRGFVWLELFVAATILCVLLHELGHAFAAQFAGVRVHDILLLPIGGAARLEQLPGRPWHEAGVAFAGPLVNLLIGLALSPVLFILPQQDWWPWLNNYTVGSMLACLAFFNLIVFAFNLIPAFPLDGGRVLRATLCNWMSRIKATKITSLIARVLALVGFAGATYYGSISLGIFTAFLFIAAGRETRNTKVKSFLDEMMLGKVALPLRVFTPEETVGDVRSHFRRNDQRGAVVADACSPIGFVKPAMLVDELDDRLLGELDLRAVVCHDSQTRLRELSAQFSEHPRSVAIEEIDHRPAGFVDLEILDEAFRAYAKTA